MTQNQIAYHNAIELQRHNQATELENARHQKAQEGIQRRSNELAEQSNLITKEHYERMDAINATHYANQDAYNLAMLAEQQRANKENEEIRQMQNVINSAANAELARHQRVTEGIEAGLAANTIQKTQYEMSYISANADYTRQKALESGAHTGLINQQTITELSRGQNIWADTYLKQQQKSNLKVNEATQRSQTYLNVSNAFDTNISSAQKLLRLFTGGAGIAMR